MKRYVLLATLLLIYLFVLSGCAGGDVYQLKGDNPVIIVRNSEDGMDAEVKGTLLYDRDQKFLLLDVDGDDKQTVPIWPKGTKPIEEDGKHGVDIPEHGKVFEGSSIHGGGGWIENTEIKDLELPEKYSDASFVVISYMVD